MQEGVNLVTLVFNNGAFGASSPTSRPATEVGSTAPGFAIPTLCG